jgi:hypothetical protein
MQSASVNQFCKKFTFHLKLIVLKESFFFFVAIMEEIFSLRNTTVNSTVKSSKPKKILDIEVNFSDINKVFLID